MNDVQPFAQHSAQRDSYFSNLHFSSTPITPVTGTITDQNENNIKDAVVIAHVFSGFFTDVVDPNNNHHLYPIDNSYYTFTNSNASGSNYSITPFDPARTTDASKQYIRWLEVTATGAEKKDTNHFEWVGQPPFDHDLFHGDPPAFANLQNYSLTKISMQLDDVIDGITISSAHEPEKARLNLTVQNTTITSTGAVDFTALDAVNVQSEFHATQGSDVHIYNSLVQLDCQEIIDANPPYGFRTFNSNNISDNNLNYIELTFRKFGAEINIYPNPNTGVFAITVSGYTDLIKTITILNLLGSVLSNNKFSGNSTELDLSEVPKGIYYIRVNDQNKLVNKTIIIQ